MPVAAVEPSNVAGKGSEPGSQRKGWALQVDCFFGDIISSQLCGFSDAGATTYGGINQLNPFFIPAGKSVKSC